MPARKPKERLAIVTDSSACLPTEVLKAQGIITVPLAFQFDGEQFMDGDLPAGKFYRRLEESKKPPSTAAPGPGEFLDAFRRAAEAGATSVLCITLSADYSGTYEAAARAAEEAATAIPGVRVEATDSGGLAMTHGFAVLEAARAASAGASLEEAAALARAVGARAQMAGVLETMRYLARSGRVPRVVHGAASLLRVHPVIAFEGAKPRSIARVRSAVRGDETVLHYLQRRAGPREGMHVAIMHANTPGRAARLAERVKEELGPVELLVTEVTPVMGVHTGPGFVGVAFYSDEGIPRPKVARSRWGWLLERDVRILEGVLDDLPPGRDRPPLAIVLSGLPGAGKSHLARALAARHPFAHMDSDKLRRALFKSPKYTQGENFRLFSAYHELMGRLLGRGVSVICDATNLKEAHRKQLYEVAEKQGARLLVVQVEAARQVVEKRLDRRMREPGPWDESEAGHDIYERMRAEAEPILREHMVVETSGDIGPGVERVLQEAGLDGTTSRHRG